MFAPVAGPRLTPEVAPAAPADWVPHRPSHEGKKKGGKKRKAYATPKKNKHKHVNVKLQALNYYAIKGDGSVERTRKLCEQETCKGKGVLMANHWNRYYCGKCALTLLKKDAPKEEPKKQKVAQAKVTDEPKVDDKKKGGKKKKGTKEEPEPQDEYMSMDGATLEKSMAALKERLEEAKIKRNLIQIEKDLIHDFYHNTRVEIKETEAEIKNYDTEM
jgi:small subunit ribosomal protein S27Ae